MRIRRAILCLLLSACAGTEATYHATTPRLPAAEERLFDLLPSGGQSCAIAWPGRVPAARRALLARAARSDALVWSGPSPFSIWVQTEQRAAHRTPSLVAVARVSDMEAARDYLTRSAHVLWDSPRPCPEPGCRRTFAQAVDEHTIRITRGRWTDSPAQGALPQCRALAGTEDAAEIAGRIPQGRTQSTGDAFIDDLGYAYESRLILVSRGVDWTEVMHAEDPMLAEEIVRIAQVAAQYGSASTTSVQDVLEVPRRAHGSDVIRSARILWLDLEMLAADARFWREALADEAVAERPVPIERVDYLDRAMVATQIRLRKERLEQAVDEARVVEASALRRLLEEALAVHADDHDYSLLLTRTLLDPLGQGAAAREIAERVLARGEGDPRLWRGLLRNALALSDEQALRRALVTDEIATTSDAADAARVLAALAGHGAYEEAEGAWMSSRAMSQIRERTRATPPAVLPLGSLFETLLAVVEERDMTTRSVHVRVLADRLPPGAHGGPMERVQTWERDASRGFERIGAGLTDAPDGLHALGQNLVQGMVEGAVSITLAIVPIGGDLRRPEHSLRVEGELEEGGLRVVATSRGDLDWPAVARYLGGPLDTLAERVFPPPDIEAQVPPEMLDVLLERAETDDVLLCGLRSDSRLYCTAASDRLVTRRAWRVVVAPLVESSR